MNAAPIVLPGRGPLPRPPAGASIGNVTESAPEEERFYAALGEVTDFSSVMQPSAYSSVPASYWIALTDVRGSTKAIEAGRYKDVNAVGVASIIGLSNALRDVELAYVFGGDGATILVPGSRKEAAERALRGARWLAREAFELELRVGMVPLSELTASGGVAKVAKFRASEHTRLAMFSGSAFSLAERWVKDPERGLRYEVSQDGEREANFEGFECRWRPIDSKRGTMVSLLVAARDDDETERAKTYTRVLGALEERMDAERCRPVRAEGMHMLGPFGDYSVEARIRAGAPDRPTVAAAKKEARLRTQIARMLRLFGKEAGGFNPASYMAELEQNTDFRKFDELLRMVVDLNTEECASVRAYLDEERRSGAVAYGLHQAPAALMTCLVRSYSGDHVHFIDGAEGGYALAAKELKRQLAEAR